MENIDNKFFLFPNFNSADFKSESFDRTLKLILITINIINQIFLLNFYFIVTRTIILRQDHVKYFEGKK